MMTLVLAGSIDPLQNALNASAAIAAGNWRLAHIDAETIISVLSRGEHGLPESARAMGFTVPQVQAYAAEVFGPKLYARFVPAAARGTPMASAVERLRRSRSYDYIRALPRKDREQEFVALAAAHSFSIGESGSSGYQASLEMLQVVVPLLMAQGNRTGGTAAR
jgi:hypothetical protein